MSNEVSMTTDTEVTHTPGPWCVEAVNRSNFVDIVGPKGEEIGYANRSDGADEPTFYPATENARLMAAAPELLTALKVARNVLEVACGTTAPYIREAFKIIDPAIRKAEGHL